jgi:hypothetical protein
MTAWRPVILAVALAPLAGFPQDLSPEVLMLARVKSHAREELARIPNYTCVEVLQRFHKTSGPKSTMKPLDTMQLEVAQIGGREMYSWLGDRNFKEDDPAAFIGSGMIPDTRVTCRASAVWTLPLPSTSVFPICPAWDRSSFAAAGSAFPRGFGWSGKRAH